MDNVINFYKQKQNQNRTSTFIWHSWIILIVIFIEGLEKSTGNDHVQTRESIQIKHIRPLKIKVNDKSGCLLIVLQPSVCNTQEGTF